MSETKDVTNCGIVDASKADAIAAVRENSWEEGKTCPTCDGGGRVSGGMRRVHCIGGFMGADWNEQGVIEEIENAKRVAWIDHWSGHDLVVVTADDQQWSFEVRRPEGVLPGEDQR